MCQALTTVVVSLMMYSFMGGGLFCAIVGNILLVVSTATDYWMQYRLSGSFAHQGLWRYCMSGKCYMQTDSIGEWNISSWAIKASFWVCWRHSGSQVYLSKIDFHQQNKLHQSNHNAHVNMLRQCKISDFFFSHLTMLNLNIY